MTTATNKDGIERVRDHVEQVGKALEERAEKAHKGTRFSDPVETDMGIKAIDPSKVIISENDRRAFEEIQKKYIPGDSHDTASTEAAN